MDIEFLKLAQLELDDAFGYYESELQGLGYKFLLEVKNSIKRILSYPKSYQEIGQYSRRCLVQKFPYGIIYQCKKESSLILIVAIAHLHRKPDYWLSREL